MINIIMCHVKLTASLSPESLFLWGLVHNLPSFELFEFELLCWAGKQPILRDSIFSRQHQRNETKMVLLDQVVFWLNSTFAKRFYQCITKQYQIVLHFEPDSCFIVFIYLFVFV